jgi:hypothetical protein
MTWQDAPMPTENSNASTTAKVWLLFGVSTVGMLIFAGLYFLTPKTSGSIQTATQTVTNEVLKEVPKEVEKNIKVPAGIPAEYLAAMNFFQKMTNASYAPLEQVLFNMKDVCVACTLDEGVKQGMTEDEAKAKFELTLRQKNVPLKPNSANVVHLSIEGFFNTEQTMLTYTITCNVDEAQCIFRKGECHAAMVRVWTKGNSFGIVGKDKANEVLLNDVEKTAVMFANDFLSANPKQQ